MSAPHHDSNGLEKLYEAAGERTGEQRTLIVLAVVGVALALILAAFFVGREFGGGSSGGSEDEAETIPPASADVSEADADNLAEAALGGPVQSPEAEQSEPPQKRNNQPPRGKIRGQRYQGKLSQVNVKGARATCRSRPSTDGRGNRVTYPARNVIDDRPRTAWRCPGHGRGQRLILNLGGKRHIGLVGMVPGYAKTDPQNGVDRYRQNRRVAKVRWTFDGRRWIEQELRTAPGNRSLQTIRIPRVQASRVTITIKESVRSSLPNPRVRRNMVAISSVRIGSPAGG